LAFTGWSRRTHYGRTTTQYFGDGAFSVSADVIVVSTKRKGGPIKVRVLLTATLQRKRLANYTAGIVCGVVSKTLTEKVHAKSAVDRAVEKSEVETDAPQKLKTIALRILALTLTFISGVIRAEEGGMAYTFLALIPHLSISPE
jgi:hypothetical protein